MGRKKGRHIPNELTNIRWSFGLSQQDAALRLGGKQSKLSLWELGKAMPSAKNIMRLKKLYKTSFERMYPVMDKETASEIEYNEQEIARQQNEENK